MAWVLAAASLVAGCQSTAPNTEPEGGYLAFRQALLEADSDALWESIADETKQVFRDAFTDLIVLGQSINQLPPTDRMLARERTAIFLLSVANNPKRLFTHLLRLDNLLGQDVFAVGSEIVGINLDPAGYLAAITTRAGQVIDVVREDDGIWRVRSLTHIAHERLRPLQENVMAVEIMLAESGHRRRSHSEIMALLSGEGSAEPNGTPSEENETSGN